MYEQLEAETK
jgi:tetratricopeptide (TPR) repeat protein